MLANSDSSNRIFVGKSITAEGFVRGSNNRIEIAEGRECTVRVEVSGNENSVIVGPSCMLKGLIIRIGNHVQAHGVRIEIGRNTSFEPGDQIIAPNSGNVVSIGEACMFSNSIIIRAGESPHLIFDSRTGEFLDFSEGVHVGNHVWVGERSYITKRAYIADECIIAACAVVTKRFDEPNIVLGGNPARVIRRGVQWVRNASQLTKDSAYKRSYEEHQRRLIPGSDEGEASIS